MIFFNNADGLLQLAVSFNAILRHWRGDSGVQRRHWAAKVVQCIAPAKRCDRLSSAEDWVVLGACVTSQFLGNWLLYGGDVCPSCSRPSWQQLPECFAVLVLTDGMHHCVDDVLLCTTPVNAKTAWSSGYAWWSTRSRPTWLLTLRRRRTGLICTAEQPSCRTCG